MKLIYKLILTLIIFLGLSNFVTAAGDLTNQNPIELTVKLGNSDDALAFFPSSLSFETGKLYKLTISNPSPQKHYFSSEKMSQSVFTRKVQVNNHQGDALAEIKGHIREIEVYPGGISQWWFVPVKSGSIEDLRCTIAGHTEAGMIGNITIE